MHFEFENVAIPPLPINQQFVFLTELPKGPQGIAVIYISYLFHQRHRSSFSAFTELTHPARYPLSLHGSHSIMCMRVSHSISFHNHNSLTPTKLLHTLNSTFLFALHSHKSLIVLRKDTDMHIFWHEMTHRWSHTRTLV